MTFGKAMKCLIFTFILSTCLSTSYAQTENATRPEVTIPQGTIQGVTVTTRNNRSISAFFGIPYGQPPVGELRFANPIAAGGWDGVRDGSVEGNVCPQGTNLDEDCLYLNLYTPQLPDNTTTPSLPVMVYIHGGAFFTGSSSFSTFGPQYLLDKDVIQVNMNYRLGILGFLSTGDEVASGNWGLKDIVLSLKWIQDNIAYFGGDPNRVTIFGQSAGGVTVHLLALSDAAEGLFNSIISQSGVALTTWAHRPREAFSQFAYQAGDIVNCSSATSEALIACLRTVNVSDMLAVHDAIKTWERYPVDLWGPTDEPDVEGAIILDSPINIITNKGFRNFTWMCGNVRDEGAGTAGQMDSNEEQLNQFIANYDVIVPAMFTWFYQSDGGAAWAEATKAYYFNNDFTMTQAELIENFTRFFTDANNMYASYNSLQRHVPIVINPTYYYQLHYVGSYSSAYGVGHSDDLAYLFPRTGNTVMTEADNEIVDIMVDLWTSFATNGIPTTTALNGTTWEPYSLASGLYLRIGNDSDTGLEIQPFPGVARMEFWDGLYELLDNPTSSAITLTSNLIFVFLFACLKLFY